MGYALVEIMSIVTPIQIGSRVTESAGPSMDLCKQWFRYR